MKHPTKKCISYDHVLWLDLDITCFLSAFFKKELQAIAWVLWLMTKPRSVYCPEHSTYALCIVQIM